MELRRLRLFLAVADHGSFTGAAAAEYMTQASLTQAIRDFEREVGLQLFRRNGRHVVLTIAGETLVGPAREALAAFDACHASVTAITGLVSGRLDICCMAGLQAHPLADIVGMFRQRYPGVDVEIDAPDDQLEIGRLVASGRYDLGVSVEGAIPSHVVLKQIAHREIQVVFPPGHESPEQVTNHELAALPLISTPNGAPRITKFLLENAGRAPRIAVKVSDRSALIPLVLAGAGVALLPSSAAEFARRQGARVARCDSRLSERVFVFHRQGRLRPLAAAFLGVVDEHDRPRPRPDEHSLVGSPS